MEDTLTHAENLTRLGIELQEKGRLDDALEAFERALTAYPEFPTALLRRGHVRLQKQEFDAALSDIERVIAIDAGDQRAWAYRGLAYQGKGDDVQAIADFTRALEIREAGSVHYCRGFSHQRMGHAMEAAADFRRAHDLAVQGEAQQKPSGDSGCCGDHDHGHGCGDDPGHADHDHGHGGGCCSGH